MQKSLGLIETQGLAGGIEAADAAVKSANVELIGYELTRGGGWTTVKIQGDVGAVKAAVDAARIAAGKVSRVVSTRVIPRPADGLAMLIRNGDTVGYDPPKPPPEPEPPAPPPPPAGPDEPEKEEAAPPPEAETPAPPEAGAETPEAGADLQPDAEDVPGPPEQEPEQDPGAPAEPGPEAVQEEPEQEILPAEDTAEAASAKPKQTKRAPAKKGVKRKQ